MNPYREAPAPELPCPRCGGALAPRSVADARVDECGRCGGVFVAAALMPRVLDALDLGGEVLATFPRGTPVAHPGGPLYIRCPRCDQFMSRRLFADGAKVIVDVCAKDGVWFDDAELRAIAEFAASGGMERAAARAADEARRREREAHAARAAAEGRARGLMRDVSRRRGGVIAVLFDWMRK